MRLQNKVCIITGAAHGIGKTAAELFAREGATVIIADYDEAGETTASSVSTQGEKCKFVQVDVSDRSTVDRMVKDVVNEFGRIDVLINNAGVTADSMLLKMTPDQWNKVLQINLTGVFNCTQAIAEVMVQQGKGKIINTSSVVGVYGNIGQTNYAATKSGVIGMTKTWAKELGRKGINVNAVAPGFIVTTMTGSVPEKVLDEVRSKTPLGRLGKPIDIANAYLFLASDAADFINGVTLSVDGGLVL